MSLESTAAPEIQLRHRLVHAQSTIGRTTALSGFGMGRLGFPLLVLNNPMSARTSFESAKGERQFWRESTKKPLGNGFWLKPEFWGKFLNAPRNAMNRMHAVSSHVPHLLFLRCPDYISRLIAFGVVLPFQSHAWSWISHIFKKVLKSLPPFADGYSPSSVVFVVPLVRVKASLNHALPDVVDSGSRHSVPIMPMFLARRSVAHTQIMPIPA